MIAIHSQGWNQNPNSPQGNHKCGTAVFHRIATSRMTSTTGTKR